MKNLEETIKLIKDCNIKQGPLDLIFKESELKYNEIREVLYNKLNQYPNINELYAKISYKSNMIH